MANRATNNAIVIFITMMFTTTSHISNIILPFSSGNIQRHTTSIFVEAAVSTKQTVVRRATPPVDWDEESTASSSSYNKRNQQRRIRHGGGAASAAASATASASSESLVTGDLPPLSPEQIVALEAFEEDNELGRQLLKDKKGADKRYPLFGYGSPKKGPKGSKKHYGGFGGGGLFGPGPKASKKIFKKHNKKGYYGTGGGLFNNNGFYGAGPAAAAYGPNSYGYGYNRPGVNLGAILGPIIGIAVVACIAAKFCCLW